MPLSVADKRQSRALAAEHRAVEDAGAHYVDLRSEICPDDRCTTFRDGVWIYRDGLHLSTTFSHQLAPALAAELRRI